MDQPTFSAEGWWSGGSSGVGGLGEVGFDVSPGWRRALIAEGGKGERMGAEECGRAEDGHGSTTATLPLFERSMLGAAAKDVVPMCWISSGKCVNHACVDSEAGSRWMKFKRSIFFCCLL